MKTQKAPLSHVCRSVVQISHSTTVCKVMATVAHTKRTQPQHGICIWSDIVLFTYIYLCVCWWISCNHRYAYRISACNSTTGCSHATVLWPLGARCTAEYGPGRHRNDTVHHPGSGGHGHDPTSSVCQPMLTPKQDPLAHRERTLLNR